MQIETLKKVFAASAADICALAAAGGFKLEARAGVSPADFLKELVAAERLNEAVQFLAFALPPREAVWWACVCARHELIEPVPALLQEAIDAAESWVRNPSEPNRRIAVMRAQAADVEGPASLAAMAAFWSGGSLAPENLPEVPAPPHLMGSAVAGAVMLSAVKTAPQRANEKRERYLAAGVDIANGGNGRAKLAGK